VDQSGQEQRSLAEVRWSGEAVRFETNSHSLPVALSSLAVSSTGETALRFQVALWLVDRSYLRVLPAAGCVLRRHTQLARRASGVDDCIHGGELQELRAERLCIASY
jgi:hypothetical protein